MDTFTCEARNTDDVEGDGRRDNSTNWANRRPAG